MVLAPESSAMEGELEVNPTARGAAPPDRAVRRPEHTEGSLTRHVNELNLRAAKRAGKYSATRCASGFGGGPAAL
jgi:hypothetical protein